MTLFWNGKQGKSKQIVKDTKTDDSFLFFETDYNRVYIDIERSYDWGSMAVITLEYLCPEVGSRMFSYVELLCLSSPCKLMGEGSIENLLRSTLKGLVERSLVRMSEI